MYSLTHTHTHTEKYGKTLQKETSHLKKSMYVFRLHTFLPENGSLTCYNTCLIVAHSPKVNPHKTPQSGLLVPEQIILHIVPWAVFKTEFGSVLLSFNLDCLVPFLCWTCLLTYFINTLGTKGKLATFIQKTCLKREWNMITDAYLRWWWKGPKSNHDGKQRSKWNWL